MDYRGLPGGKFAVYTALRSTDRFAKISAWNMLKSVFHRKLLQTFWNKYDIKSNVSTIFDSSTPEQWIYNFFQIDVRPKTLQIFWNRHLLLNFAC